MPAATPTAQPTSALPDLHQPPPPVGEGSAAARERVLRIRTRAEHGRVVVEVADSGIGMSPDVQKRVFEPFFTTKPEGRGTGLGLSVSYGIVQTHGGTLTVHSAPGAGATFRLSLPALASTERANA